MRVLIATDAFPPKCGGSGWSTYYLARALRSRGHWVEVILPKEGAPGMRTRAYDNLPVTEFGYRAANLPGLRAWQRASVLDTEFSALLAEHAREANLIHAQHLLTIPAAVNAGRAAKVGVVSTVRDYWPVCLYGSLWRVGTRLGGEICPVCHGGELVHCLRQKYGAAAPLARPFLKLVERELARRQRALRESDAVVAVSSYVAGTLREIVDANKVSVVPNLVDIEEIHRIVEAGPRDAIPAGPYLLFIGKLNELKGADLLGEIMRRVSTGRKLIVVGDGPLAATIAREPNTELRGWLPNQEALCLLAHAQALVFPSRWAEPLARVLLEAQALGTPTAALDTGGTRDIIENEVNGLLASNVEGLAAQVERLITDESLCQRLRLSAQKIAQERFGDKVIAGQMEQVYERAMGSRGK